MKDVSTGALKKHRFWCVSDAPYGWIFPLERQINFPAGADLSIIIQALLDDLEKRQK